MSKTKKAAWIAALVLLFSVTARAQDQQDEPIKLKSDLVTITASVNDRNSNAIKSLRAEDFTVYEDGTPQKIELFNSTEEPFTLMLLLDLSGSTRDDLTLIKNAAKNFLKELRDKDRVGVIVFSGDVEMIAEFTDTRVRVESEIDRLTLTPDANGHHFNSSTGTSFYDALYLAVEESPLKAAEGRKAIVCVSDGVDSTSKSEYREVAKLLEKSQASVYFLELNTEATTLAGLLIDDRSNPNHIDFSQAQVNRFYDEYEPESAEKFKPRRMLSQETRRKINAGLYKIARREMKELATRTGGREYPVRSLGDLAGVYKQVADDLRSQYSIGYYSTNSTNDGRWRTIRVEVKSGATVRARSGYWAK
jgi:VWFA-related protein